MIALSVIAGDSWQADEIKAMLASVEPHVAAIYVNYNGEKSRVPAWARWTSTPIIWGRNKWEDDFAKARMQAYTMIPKDEYGWWMWIDCDDVLLTGPDGFDPVWGELDQYTRGCFMRYDYGVVHATDQVVVEQWRERLLSLDWVWAWRYPIHELCYGPPGTTYTRLDTPATEDIAIRHQREAGEDRGAKDRNRRILMKALKDYPDDPRYQYNFANECLREADLAEKGSARKVMLAEAAITQYQRFLNMESGGDDGYAAANRIGDLFLMKEDPFGALDAYLQAAKYYPSWPDAWLGAARSCMMFGDFGRMYTFADIASKLPRPKTTAAIEPLDYGYSPLLLRAIASDEQGNLDEAIKDYKAAQKIFDDPEVNLTDRIKMLRKRIRDHKSAPDVGAIRARLRGTKKDKSIFFFTQPIHEVWNQKTLAAGGHGGAETLVLELAPRFAADGWRVCIFGTPGEEIGEHDGVEYWRSDDWSPVEPSTVFVSSRSTAPFYGPIDARMSYLWLHDVNVGPELRNIVGRNTGILPISRWHMQHIMRLYGITPEYMHVVPNGIDLSLFPDPNLSDGHRFIWSSSPDRGLDTLSQLWPMVKEMIPDATLEVFYGWDYIDKVIAYGNAGHLQALKNDIMQTWDALGGEDAGLFWRGRVPPQELAVAQLNSDVWAYPTDFMETYCLTAVQMQAAGVLPITSRLAALTENVANDWLMLEGWPRNVDYQGRFLALIRDVLSPENAEMRMEARLIGRGFAETQTYDNAYTKWNDMFLAHGLEV